MKEKLWTRSYLFVILTSTFQNCQMQMVNPLMSKYASSLGIDMNIVGIIVGLMALSAMVSRPISGKIADRFDNKRVAAISGAAMGLATVGYLVAGELIPLLFLFRFLHGVSFSICSTTIMRMASYLIPASRLGEGMGFFGLGQVLATAVAPGIGIALSNLFSYTVTFVTASGIAAGLGVMTLFISMPPSEPKTAGSGAPPKKDGLFHFKLSDLVAREGVIFAIIAAALSFANGMEVSYMVQYGEGMGIEHVASYFAVSAIMLFVTRATTGKLVDRKGLASVLLPGLILVTVSMLLLASVGSLFVYAGATPSVLLGCLLLAATLKAFGQGSGQPAIQTKILQAVPKSRRGLASSTYYMGCDIGQGLGPMVGGFLVANSGFPAAYLSAAVVVAAGLALYFFTKDRLGRPAPAAGQ